MQLLLFGLRIRLISLGSPEIYLLKMPRMGYMKLDIKQNFTISLIFITLLKFLSNPLKTLTNPLFYLAATFVATSHSPIASGQSQL
jgi:hypothetical protein